MPPSLENAGPCVAAVCLCAPLGVAAQPNVEVDYFASQRRVMVDEQIRGRGIEEPRLLNALGDGAPP